jgi:hypothetical protein
MNMKTPGVKKKNWNWPSARNWASRGTAAGGNGAVLTLL